MTSIKKGDFSTLANDYAAYRPSYNEALTNDIVRNHPVGTDKLRAADVGAGTGIFTRLLVKAGAATVTAVEPNDNMRAAGAKMSTGPEFGKIRWMKGSAEQTGLDDRSVDLVSMASSFHWADTEVALAEFDRILSEHGVFVAIWNPRITEKSEVETIIQNELVDHFGLKNRVSSGRSGIAEKMTDILSESPYFGSVTYVEATDVVERSPADYVGAWRSVNDIRAQLGEENFSEFIEFVEKTVATRESVPVHYLTRAWIAQK
ncbi:methyltransferase domain-containing protein [Thalassobaculum sp. OXR-137]|uniref:class I SAM-dependent methyltransferase n=1 Tax=Thalassobaculum sp. OXR-137 TaxID=3100173 RepID=UPI002AC90D15|nr:methyltransferase domain-containing protein [Thalassobaculum sp. OXR-137]WPZ36193.1 methyltransferase domain-containing protein [Thalassobaculum sp. OXR-137]